MMMGLIEGDGEYCKKVGSGFSRFVNAGFGGDPELTVCAQAGRDDLWFRSMIDWFALAIFGEWEHCKESWEYHLEMSRQTLIKAMEMEVQR